MVFEQEQKVAIPTKDLLSYIFDDPQYDIDKPIYIDVMDPSNSVSYRQARTLVRQLAAGFRAAGLQRGDCVNVHSFNDIHYSILFLGIIAAGGIFAGTNPAYTRFELAHHIKTAKVRFLISEPEISAALVEAAKDTDIPPSRIWIFDNRGQPIPSGSRSWRELLTHGEEDWFRFDDLDMCKHTTAARLFSSGTTGMPKAVMTSHYNLIAQHVLVYEVQPKPYAPSRVVAVPSFHASSVPSTHVSALRAGHVIYVMRRFDLEQFLTKLQEYNVTDVMVVPAMAIAIIMSPFTQKSPWLKKVKAGACGAAPLDKDAQARFLALMSEGAPLTQVWGMTETTCIATMFHYPEHDHTGSVGRLLPNMQAKLIDDDGKDISAYGVRGELCVRGPIVTNGYFGNAAANRESFDNEGWFKTGDIAYCDADSQKWYIVDRKKELIKVRGFQVAPTELEAVLLSHPQIVDAGVIGVKFGRDESELPRAYVVRRPGPEGDKLTEEDVKKYVGARLARYKNLDGGVLFIDAVPKNASGKILKRVMREMANAEIEAGVGQSKL